MVNEMILQQLQKAYHFFANMNLEGYTSIMEDVREQINQCPVPEEILGEYYMTEALGYMTSPTKMLSLFQKATTYMSHFSRVFPHEAPLFCNYYNVFAICNEDAGQAEEKGKVLEILVKVFHQLTGGGLGTDLCYQAQLAYYRGELEKAKVLATEAFHKARDNHQTLVELCVCDVLADIALHELDDELWEFACQNIRQMTHSSSVTAACRQQAQAVYSMMEMSIGYLYHVPEWIAKGKFAAISTQNGYKMVGDELAGEVLPSAMLAYLEYTCYSGNPVQALLIADVMQKVYGIHNVITDSYLEMFRACCYKQLGEQESVQQCLRKAMEMICQDELWIIISVFEEALGEVLNQSVTTYDSYKAKKMKQIGADYHRKIRKLHNKTHNELAVTMTRREEEVVRLLLEGMTNHEIADRLRIKERTVRTHLEHVYSKFHVKRRMELVEVLKYADCVQTAVWIK